MPSYIELDKQTSLPASPNAGKVLFGINTAGEAQITDSSGNIHNFGTGSSGGGTVSVIDTTYTELIDQINSSSLTPGSMYRLTDYRSVNFLNGQNTADNNYISDAGDLDTTFYLGTGSLDAANVVKVQPDNKVLVAGSYSTPSSSIYVNGLVRLNEDGTLDQSFIGHRVDGNIYSIDIQSDNKILLGGSFGIYYTDTWEYTSLLTGSLYSNYYGTFYNAFPEIEAVGNYIIGSTMIMWDTANDDYYKIKFTKWTQNGNGGGFAYTRQLITPAMDEPVITFEKTNYGAEVDVISPGVLEITRGLGGALYNVIEESSWDQDISPTGTLWYSSWKQVRDIARLNPDGTYDTSFEHPYRTLYGWEDLTNVADREYASWVTSLDGAVGEVALGTPLIMHDTENSDYYIIKFTDWGNDNGGSFAYKRQLITPTMDSPIVEFVHTAGGDEVDIISEGVLEITRGVNQGLYNQVLQESYSNGGPLGTEWNSVWVYNDLDYLGTNNEVRTIKVQPTGKVLVGGRFTELWGDATSQLLQLTNSGSIDNTFSTTLEAGTVVRETYTLGSGNILVALNGKGSVLLRISNSGSIDETFSTDGYGGDIYTIGVLSDDTIIVGGNFESFAGNTHPYIVNLDSDGYELNSDFVLGFDGSVSRLLVDSEDRIIVGGNFTTYNYANDGDIVNAPYIARLFSDGTPDEDFYHRYNSNVTALDLTSDNKVVVGGTFSETPYPGKTQRNISRLLTERQYTPEAILTHTGITEVLQLSAVSSNTLAPTAYSETYPQDILQYNPKVSSLGAYQEFQSGNSLPNGNTVTDFDIYWDNENAQAYIKMPTGYPVCFGKELYIAASFPYKTNQGTQTAYLELTFTDVQPGIQDYTENTGDIATRIEVSADGRTITLLDLGIVWADRYDGDLYVEHSIKVADAYGLVTRREDTVSNNRIPFDYRSVSYRRYEYTTDNDDLGTGYYGIYDNFDPESATGDFNTYLAVPANNNVYNVNWQGTSYDVDNSVLINELYSVNICDGFVNNTFNTVSNSNFRGYVSSNIGIEFRYNNVDYLYGNQVGDGFYLNDIKGDFTNNNILSNFTNNVIYTSIDDVDFTKATHVYEVYLCNIHQASDESYYLSYTDSTPETVFTTITS